MAATALLIVSVLIIIGTVTGINQDCPATHYEFRGRYTLGRQEEVNRTLTKIQPQLGILANCTKNTTDHLIYTVYNATATLSYLDGKQKAQVVGNNTIAIFGGRIQAEI